MKKLLDWVNNEIIGYSKDEEVPEYRIIRGNLIALYFKGSMISHMK